MELLLLFLFVWCVIPIFLCASMAGGRKQSVALWVVLSLFFGWLAVLFLALVPKQG
jgi:hypothetical protein